jgi:Tfp pilus assembly protein PilO
MTAPTIQKKRADQRWLMHLCGLVCAGGACLLFYAGLILPLDTKRAQIRDDRVAYEEAKVELANTQRALARDQTAIIEAQERLRDVVQLVPESRLNARLGELASLAETHGVTFASVKPAQAVKTPHYAATPISIDASGTYGQFLALLDGMHTDARDMEVRAFEIGGDPAPGNPRLDISLELTWFALPAVPAPAKPVAQVNEQPRP